MTLGDYCTVKRDGGRILIEVPEGDMLDYFRRADPEFPLVENRETFLTALAAKLAHVRRPTEDDEFITCLEELFRRAAQSAEE